jgi:1,4-dihydroxy-2-naphthoate octaprenyltransferase
MLIKRSGRTDQWMVAVRDFLLTMSAVFRMARPPQVLMVTAVYVFGAIIAIATGIPHDPTAFIYGLVTIIPVSMSIHYANEYADFETDALSIRTQFSGGSGVLPETGTPRRVALISAWISLTIGASLAFGGFIAGHISIATLLVLGVGGFFGWMYSLPPLQLAWRGWGELDNALLGGVLLPLYGYVAQSGRLDLGVIATCLPFAALVFVNLLATTWADREADFIVGKFTLATRWTTNHLRILYAIVSLSAFILLALMNRWLLPPIAVRVSFLVLPLLVWGALSYTRYRNPFPTVAAMVTMLFVQATAWWSVVR